MYYRNYSNDMTKSLTFFAFDSHWNKMNFDCIKYTRTHIEGGKERIALPNWDLVVLFIDASVSLFGTYTKINMLILMLEAE